MYNFSLKRKPWKSIHSKKLNFKINHWHFFTIHRIWDIQNWCNITTVFKLRTFSLSPEETQYWLAVILLGYLSLEICLVTLCPYRFAYFGHFTQMKSYICVFCDWLLSLGLLFSGSPCITRLGISNFVYPSFDGDLCSGLHKPIKKYKYITLKAKYEINRAIKHWEK